MQFSDSLPAWDDAGITALALFASAVLIGFFAKRRPWLFGLAIGTWLPLRGIIRAHDLRFLLVLLIPLVGAYCGWGMRRFARGTFPSS